MIQTALQALVLGLFLLGSLPAWAKLSVAFLEMHSPSGQRLELEPGGRFAHVAISYRNGWLHAYPRVGVSWTNDLSGFGSVALVLENGELPDLTEDRVQMLIGLPYDTQMRWSSDSAFYCSELVGKLLSLEPAPMGFNSKAWKRTKLVNQAGEPGLSPDDVYRSLTENPEWRISCDHLLAR